MAKYNKGIVKKICSLIREDSYTIVEICDRVGISKDTYHEWLKNKADFSDQIKSAQEDRMAFFVAEAKKSLAKKIQGYTVEESRTVMVESKERDASGKALPKIKEQTKITKFIQPDTTAIIFALTNGDPANWKNKQSIEAEVNVNPFNELMKKIAERNTPNDNDTTGNS